MEQNPLPATPPDPTPFPAPAPVPPVRRGFRERFRGPGLPGLPYRKLAAYALVLLFLAAGARFVSRSFRSVRPGEAGVAVNTFTGGVRVLAPGTHFLPVGLHDLLAVKVSDQVLDGKPGTFTVTTKEGVAVALTVQARWAVDRDRLKERWASLPAEPVTEALVPVLTASFRTLAPGYEAASLAAERRDELSRLAAERARPRLLESGILLKEVLVTDLKLPADFEKARQALVEENQAVERKDAHLKLRAKEVDESRLVAEAEKVRREKAAETEAAQRLIMAKGEAEAMSFILPLKEKEIRQRELEAEADKAKLVKQAEAAAAASKIQVQSDAEKRRTMADAEAYAIRATSQAQFEGLKREAELIQANPIWVSKVFAERISDKVQVILTPNLSTDIFTTEVMKRVANGKPAVAAREAAEEPEAADPEVEAGGRSAAAASALLASTSKTSKPNR